MDRAPLAFKFWFESKVPIYIERFILPVLAAVITLVVMMNIANLGWDQRIALFVGVACLAYVLATAVHRTKAVPSAQPAAASQERHSGPASSTGDQSPANTGNGNTFKYDNPVPAPKRAPKDVK